MYDSNEKMEVSVLCIPGASEKLVDNFFINGRTREWLDSSVFNVVNENPYFDGIFAVSTNMDYEGGEGNPSISFMKELKRFQNKFNSNGGELESKTNLLREQIAEVNNFIHSVWLVKNQQVSSADTLTEMDSDAQEELEQIVLPEEEYNEPKPELDRQPDYLPEDKGPTRSVACVYIENGKYTILSSGNGKVFVFNNGMAKQITNAKLRIDRLVKLGVMTEDQAKGITNDDMDGISQFPKATLSAGDTVVLCSGAATEFLDEQKLSALLSTQNNLTSKSTELLKPAVMSEIDDDLSIMIISVGRSEHANEGIYEDEDDNKFSGKIAMIFAVILALVVGLAAGFMLVPGLMGKKMVDASSKVTAVAKATKKPAVVPADVPTEVPIDAVATDVPVSEPTIDPGSIETPAPSVKPTAIPAPTLETGPDGKKYYTIVSGDSYMKIALKVYGDSKKYKDIMLANPSVKPESMQVGKKLIIP